MRGKIVTVPVRRGPAEELPGAQDLVAVEDPLQIRLNGRDLAITMRTPGDDRALAAGFLFTEGIVDRPDQIADIAEDQGTISVNLAPGVGYPEPAVRNFYMTSSCGVCGKASIDALRAAGCAPVPQGRPLIDARVLAGLPDRLRPAQAVFEHTGGLHAAGLFDQAGTLLDVREDVGRHNAVDKLIGTALFDGRLPLDTCILMLSGRVSFELVQKALRARIPVIAAIGAPSSLAVETALRFGMTLAGFVRGGQFNLYCGYDRIRQAIPAPAGVVR